jgi:hypothetical protein
MLMLVGHRGAARNTDGVMGNFTNMLPLRVAVAENMTFRDLVKQMRGVVFEALKHRDVPVQLVFNTENLFEHPLAAVRLNWITLLDHAEKLAPIASADLTFTPYFTGIGEASGLPMFGRTPQFPGIAGFAIRSVEGLNIVLSQPPKEGKEPLRLGQWLERLSSSPDAPM